MSAEPQLFRINPENRESQKIAEVDFARLGFQERRDIQEWIAANPGILGEELLIIGKEFSGFDRTNERLDLLAVDEDGKLVIIELKRDHTGSDAHWQAIKYASYLHHTNPEEIIQLLAKYENVSDEDAENRLLDHLNNPESLNVINNDQRIILASHKFAPEVTSAALWLNEKAPGEDLITCVQLTPYQDTETNSLYIQANTIIPVPGIEDYIIRIYDSSNRGRDSVRKSSSQRQINQNDDITRFLRGVGELVVKDLPQEIKPDKRSQHAGGSNPNSRYYHLWYSHSPWGNWDMSYRIEMRDAGDSRSDKDAWQVDVGFGYRKSGKKAVFSPSETEDLESRLSGVQVYDDQKSRKGRFGGIIVSRRIDEISDKTSANLLVDTLRPLVEAITPIIDEFEDERTNQESIP